MKTLLAFMAFPITPAKPQRRKVFNASSLRLCAFAGEIGNAMKANRVFNLIATLLTAVAVVAQEASRLQQDVSYLASDALDGRRTGTAGANAAARYIAGEFERAGLH